MFSVSRFTICLLFVLSFSTLLSAQEQRSVDGPKLSPVITAATAGENVRFGSPAAGIAQIRVQIMSASGDPLFDSAWKDGNVFDWPIESPGQPLANGSYRCVVMVKDLDGQMTQKEAVLTAEGGQVSIEARAGDEGLTIVGAGESGPKITMLVHDEKNGAIVNTSGDLSFRFGEFFAGKDSERMRLTAEGSLGIGTDTPQAPLDVNGLIRTSKGILFPDGTILTTAGGEAAATGPSGGANPLTRSAGGGAAPGSQTSGTPRRLTPRPDAAGYQFVVDSAGVHIGTTSAYGLDVAGNVTLSSNLALPGTSATAGVITLSGSRFVHAFGPNNTFLGPNAGNFIMSGRFNTGSGDAALQSNTSGFYNTGTGGSALQLNSTGHSNTANGVLALYANTSGNRNTASGVQALTSNTTGSENTASGIGALQNNTASGNTASGAFALQNNTTGGPNTASGVEALRSNTTGGSNTASGSRALLSNTIGNNNTASGSYALANNSSGTDNTASGFDALLGNTTGNSNTASGASALRNNTTGSENTASGFRALNSNTASGNTASGASALANNTSGSSNTASGASALANNTTGSSNTASGTFALQSNTAGSNNTACGAGALRYITGSNNIAVGARAGETLTTGSNNIYIGNKGTYGTTAFSSDTGAIRIGEYLVQTKAFIEGIRGVPTGAADALFVAIDSNGQLGTINSSASVKRDIAGVGEQSSALMKLRPVSFFYRSDAVGFRQYGLIAEEVAEVMPELVQFSPGGEAETVRYHFLAPLLLDQVQKQHRQIEEQQKTIDALNTTLKVLGQRMQALERQVAPN